MKEIFNSTLGKKCIMLVVAGCFLATSIVPSFAAEYHKKPAPPEKPPINHNEPIKKCHHKSYQKDCQYCQDQKKKNDKPMKPGYKPKPKHYHA